MMPPVSSSSQLPLDSPNDSKQPPPDADDSDDVVVMDSEPTEFKNLV